MADHLQAYDALYCLGDIVGYGPEPNEVVQEIRRLKPDIVLMGNHDQAVVTGDTAYFTTHAALAVEWTRRRMTEMNLRYLASLKPSAQTEAGGLSIALHHGSPRDPLNEYIFPGLPGFIQRSLLETAEADVLLMGHTHVPFESRLDSGLIANPGSVGQPRDGDPRASYALLEINDGHVDFKIARVQYSIDLVASKIRDSGLPAFLADRLYIGA